MKHRTEGHTETTISGDTRADWSEAFELVPSLEVAYVWHASVFTREVLDGLVRIGFLYPQQIIWDKGRTVLTRTHYWYQHEPCWYVRKKNAPWFGKAGENSTIWNSPSPKFIMGGSDEEKFDHPTQKPVELMRRPILNHTKRGELVYEPFLGSGTTLAAAELTQRVCYGIELDPKYVDVVVQRWQTAERQGSCPGRRRQNVRGDLERAGSVSMNRALPPGDRGHTSTDPGWAPGPGRAVPGSGGLVGGNTAHQEGVATKEARRGRSRAGLRGPGLLGHAIDALPVLALRGYDDEPHLFAERAADEAANTVRLPACGFDDLLQGGALWPLHQLEDLGGFAALARSSMPLALRGLGGFGDARRFGRSFADTGLLPRLTPGGRDSGLLWRGVGLLYGLLLLPGCRPGQVGLFFGWECRHCGFSFGGVAAIRTFIALVGSTSKRILLSTRLNWRWKGDGQHRGTFGTSA